MTTTQPESDLTDRNVTRILKTMRANRGLSVKALCLAAGVAEGTYYRRLSDGGWTARELSGFARALNVDPAVFWRDADSLIPGARRTGGTVVTDQNPVDNQRAA